MADFCKQCSIDTWGEDHRDLANVTSTRDWKNGRACVVLCEGCGYIQVDPEGVCISDDCPKHGLPETTDGSKKTDALKT